MASGYLGTTYAMARAAGALLSPAGKRARLAVFCYHQVLAERDPMRAGEPDAAQFENDVRLIARVFNVLPFGEAVRKLRSGRLPRRAACITFDDGYANNHELAAPILRSIGVPATFFVAGGAIDVGVMWNDLVIEAIAHSSGTEKVAELPAILGRLKYCPVAERWEQAERMYRESVADELPRLMMSRDMVADLARQGFEIGGHTINHPILKELADNDAQAEIEGCAAWIRDVTGMSPTTFAYPNGMPGQDFDSRHAAMAAAAGFEAAASTEWALAHAGSDLYAVPRIGPWWRQSRTFTAGLCRSMVKSYLA